MGITIGHDAELFLSNGEDIVSAIGLVGGTKADPLPVDRGALQEDNVLAELNIWPANTVDEFVSNTKRVVEQLLAKVAPLNLKVKSSHHFAKDYLMSLPQKAMEFGCDPDFNAYSEGENNPPSPRTTLRTAGGHIHIGYDRNKVNPFHVVKYMDLYLGVPSVILDTDTERRAMYGKAGACRIKPYGVEYRTLSNFWMASDELMAWAFSQATKAYEAAEQGKDLSEWTNGFVSCEDVVTIINEGQVDRAKEVVAALNLM